MKGNFRRSMIWLHTYSGLLATWLLFIVFVTGTLSYYADELDLWMQPERLSQQEQKLIPLAFDALQSKPQGASQWRVNLGNERASNAEIYWQYPGQSRREVQSESVGLSDSQPRETIGGRFFVRFHYTLELREYGGRYLAGIAAFIMLVGVFSGIFTHRRFFKDFFVLRWQNLKRALTDAHAIIGIVTIPFCFVLCASALLFYLSLYVPLSANYHYDKGYRELSSHVSPERFNRKASGQAATPRQDLQPILAQVKASWPEKHSIGAISYQHPFDQNGYLVFYRNKLDLSRQSESLVFDAQSGELLHQGQPPRVPRLISYIFLGLHEAKFADNSLRFILFLLGCLSCALIATGSILWLNNRVERNVSHAGTRLIDWSNKAVLAGLPIAILALFYGNRLIPTALETRANYELISFFCAWGLTALLAIKYQHGFWPSMLKLIALGCFALPVIDLLLPAQYLIQAIETANYTFIAIELAFVSFGATTWLLRRYLVRRASKPLREHSGTLREVTS